MTLLPISSSANAAVNMRARPECSADCCIVRVEAGAADATVGGLSAARAPGAGIAQVNVVEMMVAKAINTRIREGGLRLRMTETSSFLIIRQHGNYARQ